MMKMKHITGRKAALALAAALYTVRGHAQDARSAMNEILDGYTLPVLGLFTLVGVVAGLIMQWDNIIDKDNRGTRKEGFLALGLYVAFAMLIGIVVSAVRNSISGISLSI